MIVTIFSDISLCHKSRVGAWAMWAKSLRGCCEAQGVFREYSKHTDELELMALANAVAITRTREVAMTGDRLICQTDNLAAIRALECREQSKRVRIRMEPLAARFREIAEGCAFELRHVRAHTMRADKRSYINGVVDRKARALMQKARKEATL